MRIRAAIILITEKRLTTAMMALAMAVELIVFNWTILVWIFATERSTSRNRGHGSGPHATLRIGSAWVEF